MFRLSHYLVTPERILDPLTRRAARNANFSSHAYGVRFSKIHKPPVARSASLTGG